MRSATALALGVLLPLLGLSGIGHAQTAVQVQGTIQGVDCQSGTFLLQTPSGTSTVAVANDTPVLLNAAPLPFCALQQYVGAPVSVWIGASNNELVAARIDLLAAQPVETGPVPVPVDADVVPDLAPEPVPIVGTVLGTIGVAGLIYLLVYDNGGYYRYPYYGAYYRYYYRPEYRPYAGWYPADSAIISVAFPVTGLVLGTVTIGGLPYLLSRDRDGRFYRYPYFGPYAHYYYRPEYRQYRGAVPNAALRQGDPRWDGAGYRGVNYRPAAPAVRDPHLVQPATQRWSVPAAQTPQRWTPPAPQNIQRWTSPDPRNIQRWTAPAAPQNGQRWTPPAPQNTQRWMPPAPQNTQRWNAPTWQNSARPRDQRWSPPSNQGNRGRSAPSYRRSPSQCNGGNSNQSCSHR